MASAEARLRPWGRVARLLVLVLAGAGWSWAVVDADNLRRAEASWNRATLAERQLEAANWVASEETFEELFEHATLATRRAPGNIHYRHWLGVYKWLSLTSFLDPNTHELSAEAIPRARQIVEEMRDARPLCPTFGVLYCVSGEIRQFVLKDPNGRKDIQTGYRLAPYDATTCFVAARVDAEEGKVDEAFAKLSRAVQLDDTCFPRAVQLCIDELGGGYLALQLAGGDPDRLTCVADLLSASLAAEPSPSADMERRSAVRQLLDRARAEAFDQLRFRCAKADAPAHAHASLASLYRQRGDLDLAIRHYRRAVRLDYDQVAWRFALAELLARTSNAQEAMHEAKICLRFNENYAPAKELLRRLTADWTTREQSAAIR